jgi:hypothetical protein
VIFSPDGTPLPDSHRRQWIPLITGLILLAGAFLCGWVLIQESTDTTPSPSAGNGTPAAPARPPVELMSIASSLSTLAAPTPSPTPRPLPTPTYVMSTKTPILHCGASAGYGQECVWPEFTPTPIPPLSDCVTPVPGAACAWKGPVTPTPIPARQWPGSLVD